MLEAKRGIRCGKAARVAGAKGGDLRLPAFSLSPLRISRHALFVADNETIDSSGPEKTKPMGWLVGLGVLLITLGVIFGLVGIVIVAKRKQRYRINDQPAQVRGTNAPVKSVPEAGVGK